MPTIGTNLVIVKEGKIVVTKRNDIPMWCLPGGRVDSGESVAEAAIREALEETGLHVKLVALVGVYSRPNWRARGDHVVLFLAEPIGGELSLSNETADIGYFAPNNLPSPLLSWHHQRIADALAGHVGQAWKQEVLLPLGLNDKTRAEISAATQDKEVETAVVQHLAQSHPEKHELGHR